jgi:hypothetical protein
MYATVRRYEGVSNPTEAAQRVNEGFVPLISQIPGFVAYYWVDAGSGVMISTSVFQDQASAEESNRRAADYVQQNLVSLLPNPPQVTAGGYRAKRNSSPRFEDFADIGCFGHSQTLPLPRSASRCSFSCQPPVESREGCRR